MLAAVDLVIFDCDGVLVDSEPVALELMRATLAADGLDLPIATIQDAFQGRSLASARVILHERFGHRVGQGRLERMQDELLDVFSRELRAVPGIARVLDALTVPACVASSSSAQRLGHSLGVTGLAARFGNAVFSADAVERGKPAPDLFLYVADRMGAVPARCLVVEDSRAGVCAAAAAGMVAIGFTGGRHATGEGYHRRLIDAGASVVAEDAAALAALLGLVP